MLLLYQVALFGCQNKDELFRPQLKVQPMFFWFYYLNV